MPAGWGRRWRLPLLIAVAGVAALGTLSASPAAGGEPTPRLRVVTVDGEVLVDVPLARDGTWIIERLHSAARVGVRDAFAWRDGRMWSTDHGTPHLDVAGLGHVPGRGELRPGGAGGHWVAAIDERLAGDVHRFVIGSAHAPTTLVHDGRAFELGAVRPGVRARLEVVSP